MLRRRAVRSKRRHAPRRVLLVVAAGAFAPALAYAHFILIAPDSWMSQDSFGLPEKLGPCGDEGGGTATGKVTAFQPGQTISVTINEVVAHPGHYRVALAVNDRSELPAEPVVTPTSGDPCASAAIENPPVFPILADNVLPHTQAFTAPQTFTVTLPTNVTCTKCTLQVLEFMSNHPAPCFYHHCADISIQGAMSSCGDGAVQSGEQCDDGNTMNGDGCDSQCRIEAATATPSNAPPPLVTPTATPTGLPTPTGTAATTECGAIARPKLTVGKLKTPAGDDTLSFEGSVTLPFPFDPPLDPLHNGVQLTISDHPGTVLAATIPGGAFDRASAAGWKVSKSGTNWMYLNNTSTSSAGIFSVVVRDQSASAAGRVKFVVKGRRGAYAVGPGDLPVTARIVLGSPNGQCGEASFAGAKPAASCAYNKSGSTLTCK